MIDPTKVHGIGVGLQGGASVDPAAFIVAVILGAIFFWMFVAPLLKKKPPTKPPEE